jgi:hypothetical protein
MYEFQSARLNSSLSMASSSLGRDIGSKCKFTPGQNFDQRSALNGDGTSGWEVGQIRVLQSALRRGNKGIMLIGRIETGYEWNRRSEK